MRFFSARNITNHSSPSTKVIFLWWQEVEEVGRLLCVGSVGTALRRLHRTSAFCTAQHWQADRF